MANDILEMENCFRKKIKQKKGLANNAEYCSFEKDDQGRPG